MTECTNALKKSKILLLKNQKKIITNNNQTMIIYNKHISDKKYYMNDIDMKLIKNYTKNDLKKPNAFIYGRIRGHQFSNNKIIFFLDSKEVREKII